MVEMETEKDIVVPDMGDIGDVEIIDVFVRAGDTVAVDESLMTLESDKATMDVPSPFAGTVKKVKISVGDRVTSGSSIMTMDVIQPEVSVEEKDTNDLMEPDPAADSVTVTTEGDVQEEKVETVPAENLIEKAVESAKPVRAGKKPYASPSVRRFARELGADLSKVTGNGRKGRILKEDVQLFIKSTLGKADGSIAGGYILNDAPEIDFGKFGVIRKLPLSRVNKLSGLHLHRSWITVPHVTQHDEADITELEAFRQSLKDEASRQSIKVTLLPFIMKAVVAALKMFPTFNASLDSKGEQLVLKDYFHIGVAVDTVDGLVVPVIRDVDSKGVMDLAQELGDIGDRARNKKLLPKDLQGGSFTISSLGGISGTAFTPIINLPEVAILGISRAIKRPVYMQDDFVPRLIVPLSLSYDHRVIDGAEAARFTGYLKGVLSDLRRVLL